MSQVKGIRDYKLERLWEHLLKVEEQTGGKLRTEPRSIGTNCPIGNFAPDVDSAGQAISGINSDILWYVSEKGLVHYYPVYQKNDTRWWERLPTEKKIGVTNWVAQKIAGRPPDFKYLSELPQ